MSARPPAHLSEDLRAALEAEDAAREALLAARSAHRRTIANTTAVFAALRSEGLVATSIAVLLARVRGLPSTMVVRLRLAARIRKRLERAAVTQGHAEVPCPSPVPASRHVPSNETETTEDVMKLVKKVTVETFKAEDREHDERDERRSLADYDDECDGGCDEIEEQEDPRPARRKK